MAPFSLKEQTYSAQAAELFLILGIGSSFFFRRLTKLTTYHERFRLLACGIAVAAQSQHKGKKRRRERIRKLRDRHRADQLLR